MTILKIIVVGIALASAWYWIALLSRLHLDQGWKWWITKIVPQGVAIAAALKILGLIKI